MSVTISKKLQETRIEKLDLGVEVDPKEMSLEELVDSYGTLEDQYHALMVSPTVTQFEAIKKALSDKLQEELGPEDEAEITGEKWVLEVGACAKAPATVGDINLVRRLMGEQLFMSCVKITLKDIKDYLTPEQVTKVLQPATKYTKRRKLVSKYKG